MAAEAQDEGKSQKSSGSMGKLVLWFVVVVFSIGGGFATPLLVAQFTAKKPAVADGKKPWENSKDEVEYISFDEVVAVLGKTKFTRYLRIAISLQVPKSQRTEIEKKINAKSAVLRNRIISHVAEVTEEDLAGQHGHNQLRRNFHRFFNEILFDDGIERVQDVLFRELQVQ
jgi:flagellar basal body-associated protein FliL